VTMEQRPATVKVLCHHRHAVVHFLLARGGDRAQRPGLVGVLRGRHRRTAIGKAAPWFILSIMLSPTPCAPSTSRAAPCSCAAGCTKWCTRPWRHPGQILRLGADVRLRAHRPISAVSAGLYLGGLINETGANFHIAGMRVYRPISPRYSPRRDALLLGKNIIGIHESSEKACASCKSHRHGGDADRLVHRHHPQERLPAGAAAGARQPEV